MWARVLVWMLARVRAWGGARARLCVNGRVMRGVFCFNACFDRCSAKFCRAFRVAASRRTVQYVLMCCAVRCDASSRHCLEALGEDRDG